MDKRQIQYVMYDWMYTTLKLHTELLNVCDWHKGAHGQLECREYYHPCCLISGECEHLCSQGCTVKSLACSLWFCSSALSYLQNLSIDESHPLHKKAVSFLKLRNAFRDVILKLDIPIKSRASKEETFDPFFDNDSLIDQDFKDWINQSCPITENIDLDNYFIRTIHELVPRLN